ncbi:MAG: Head fiber protein [Lachnospiraceae bacterium]|nr:Head fiber protein [Lachnospiraceae bacterium]
MNDGRVYIAHGGRELVIGGKVTILPGACIEGADGLFDAPGEVVKLPNVPRSDATTVAAMRADFNKLIDALKAAGLMEADKE